MSRITSEAINIEKNALTEVARTEHRRRRKKSFEQREIRIPPKTEQSRITCPMTSDAKKEEL